MQITQRPTTTSGEAEHAGRRWPFLNRARPQPTSMSSPGKAGAARCRCKDFTGTVNCNATEHACSCDRYADARYCRGAEHQCICSSVFHRPKQCRSVEHFCVCWFFGSEHCRGSAEQAHQCICSYYSHGKCLSEQHDCLCKSHPQLCRKKSDHAEHLGPGRCLGST